MSKSLNSIKEHAALIREFFEYAKKALEFDDDVKLSLIDSKQNACNPIGDTADYDPQHKKIRVFITDRHVADVMKSISHEMVHHKQNLRGDFQNVGRTDEGYAQNDDQLRKMEEEAYLVGNMTYRDWRDSKRSQ